MTEFDYTVRRTEWQDPERPVSGPRFYWTALWLRVRVLFVAIHWTADPNVEAKTNTLTKAVAYVKAIHQSYLRDRGFSGGYSVVITQAGASIELRGTTFRPAATLGRLLTRVRLDRLLDPDIGLFRHLVPEASRKGNRHTVAVLILCGPGGPSRAALIEAARFIDHCQRESGRRLEIRGHSFFDPTECPGDAARADIGDDGPTDLLRRLIAGRAWAPTIPPTTPTPSPDTGANEMAHILARRRYSSRPDDEAEQTGAGPALTHRMKLADGPASVRGVVHVLDRDGGRCIFTGSPDRDAALVVASGNDDADGVVSVPADASSADGVFFVHCSDPADVIFDETHLTVLD